MAGYKNKQITRYWSNEKDIDIEALKKIFILKNNNWRYKVNIDIEAAKYADIDIEATNYANIDIAAMKYADIEIEAQKKILIESTEEAPVSV